MKAVCALLIAFAVFALTNSAGTVAAFRPAGGGPRGSVHLTKVPATFRRSDNPLAERAAMGWRDAGKTIPMDGGLYTVGGYFMNLTIGTGSGQVTFNAIVDTGSSNVASPSVGCTRCLADTLYNSSMSPTAKKLHCLSPMCRNCAPTEVGSDAVPANGPNSTCFYGSPVCQGDQCAFGISYGGTSSGLTGTTVQDTACLGDSGFCAPNVYINEITDEFPAGTQPTGIIGFAFPHNACNPTCTPTILDSFVAQGTLKPHENAFGMCTTKTQGGKMDIGYLNTSRYAPGTMRYSRVVTRYWYNIVVKDFLIDGVSIGVPQYMYNVVNDGIGAFVDSGTSVVIVSPYAFSRISAFMVTNYSSLTGVHAFFARSSCAMLTESERDAYPKMSFVIEGMDGEADFTVDMTGRNYLMGGDGISGQYCLGIAGIASIGAILGDVIMTNYYIHFDRAGRRLGFAPLLSCD